MDLVAGNVGRNTEYELVQPARLGLTFGEWLGEGALQVMEVWERGGIWRPFRDRNWLATVLPDLPQRFATHRAFGGATEASLLDGDTAYLRPALAEYLMRLYADPPSEGFYRGFGFSRMGDKASRVPGGPVFPIMELAVASPLPRATSR